MLKCGNMVYVHDSFIWFSQFFVEFCDSIENIYLNFKYNCHFALNNLKCTEKHL